MRFALATLALLAAFWTGCVNTKNAEYLPCTDQIFLVPVDSTIQAPEGGRIVTDGPNGKVDLDAVTLPYEGVILSRGYFLLLVRMAGEKAGP